jgi:DNA gyrase/topoisomerase IV subunit A
LHTGYGGGVDDDRRNALVRREIIAAYLEVVDRLEELVEICSSVEGDTDELRIEVQEAFGFSPIAADAVLAIQVRRFTPKERNKMRNELADIDRWLEGAHGA